MKTLSHIGNKFRAGFECEFSFESNHIEALDLAGPITKEILLQIYKNKRIVKAKQEAKELRVKVSCSSTTIGYSLPDFYDHWHYLDNPEKEAFIITFCDLPLGISHLQSATNPLEGCDELLNVPAIFEAMEPIDFNILVDGRLVMLPPYAVVRAPWAAEMGYKLIIILQVS